MTDLSKIVPNTPEWDAFRAEGVGGSEVAAVAGVCPYNTAYDIWLVKTKRKKGFEGNSFTQRGQELEAKARACYELMTLEDMPAALAIHPKYKVCRVSLDGISADGKLILEIKCPTGRKTIDLALKGDLPQHYMYQVQYQLAVTGAELAHFFVYYDETKERALVEVKPDELLQGKIILASLDFWHNHVLTDTPPPLTDRDAKIVDSDVIKTLCQSLKKLKGDPSSSAKKESEALKAKVLELGGHNKIRCGNVLISLGKSGKPRMTIGDEVAS